MNGHKEEEAVEEGKGQMSFFDRINKTIEEVNARNQEKHSKKVNQKPAWIPGGKLVAEADKIKEASYKEPKHIVEMKNDERWRISLVDRIKQPEDGQKARERTKEKIKPPMKIKSFSSKEQQPDTDKEGSRYRPKDAKSLFARVSEELDSIKVEKKEEEQKRPPISRIWAPKMQKEETKKFEIPENSKLFDQARLSIVEREKLAEPKIKRKEEPRTDTRRPFSSFPVPKTAKTESEDDVSTAREFHINPESKIAKDWDIPLAERDLRASSSRKTPRKSTDSKRPFSNVAPLRDPPPFEFKKAESRKLAPGEIPSVWKRYEEGLLSRNQ